MEINSWIEKITKGDRTALARAITLVESQSPKDWPKSKQLLQALPTSHSSFRVGLSGPPGVGKSSLIEKLGLHIIHQKKSVAVLAIDPASEISGGSILGDKTRMQELSRQEKAFVRPSSNRGHLGGVTSRLPGAIRLCEAAGYNYILVESVGVGQSEVDLHRMVDLFCLVAQPGAGDELQGIKKGILEYVDMIFVNKMDRDPALARTTIQQFLSALKILRQSDLPILGCSATEDQGITDILQAIQKKAQTMGREHRDLQNGHWYEALVLSEFRNRLQQEKKTQMVFESVRTEVNKGNINPLEAVDSFFKSLNL